MCDSCPGSASRSTPSPSSTRTRARTRRDAGYGGCAARQRPARTADAGPSHPAARGGRSRRRRGRRRATTPGSRQAEDERPSRAPKDSGFPASPRRPRRPHARRARRDPPDEIVLAHRDAAGRHEHVRLEAAGDRCAMCAASSSSTTGRTSTSAPMRQRRRRASRCSTRRSDRRERLAGGTKLAPVASMPRAVGPSKRPRRFPAPRARRSAPGRASSGVHHDVALADVASARPDVLADRRHRRSRPRPPWSTSSTGTIASAPSGTVPPVEIAAAVPAERAWRRRSRCDLGTPPAALRARPPGPQSVHRGTRERR